MVETLETARLQLRAITPADAQEVFENWASSAVVTKYLSWPPHASLAVTQGYLTYEEDNQQTGWGIVLKDTGQLIGSISVADKATIKTKTIGYVLGEDFWNQGYMSEALSRVIDFLFATTDVNRLEAEHDVSNPGSGRVMVKAGMTFEGVLRKAGFNNQGLVDIAMYSILRADRN